MRGETRRAVSVYHAASWVHDFHVGGVYSDGKEQPGLSSESGQGDHRLREEFSVSKSLLP